MALKRPNGALVSFLIALGVIVIVLGGMAVYQFVVVAPYQRQVEAQMKSTVSDVVVPDGCSENADDFTQGSTTSLMSLTVDYTCTDQITKSSLISVLTTGYQKSGYTFDKDSLGAKDSTTLINYQAGDTDSGDFPTNHISVIITQNNLN